LKGSVQGKADYDLWLTELASKPCTASRVEHVRTYAEATERVEMLTIGKSNNNGIIKAHMGSTNSSIESWNCGSKNHIKSKYPKAPHRSGVC
jgi:hypothetical protein